MELLQVLEEFGLNKNESAVYLSLLQLGQSSVLTIARQTAFKRPTVYLILDSLIEKGLAVVVPKEKKKLFLALSPDRLEEELARKINLIRQALPELSALYRSETAKPSIKFFESNEGMLNVYREITKRSDIKEILTFFSLELIPKEFKESHELFIKLIKEHKVKVRDIISTPQSGHFYLEQLKNFPNYRVRLAPKEFGFSSDTIIYGNKIAIFSFKKHFAIIIEGDDVAKSFKSLFELSWQSAKNFRP